MPVLLNKNFAKSGLSLEKEILSRLRRGESETFLYVVPTKRKMRELQRKFLLDVPAHISPAFHLFTFETLASALHAILCPPKRVVAGPLQGVLLQEAMRSTEHKFSYFRLRGKNRTIPRGTFHKVVEVINFLKEWGIYLPVLHEEVQNVALGERAKLTDILNIYEAYEKLLGDRFVDVHGVLKEVNDRWRSGGAEDRFKDRFPLCRTMFISGFDEFSDPELTLLHHLSSMRGIGTLVSFDYHPENEEVFGHLKENYEKILAMGFSHERMEQHDQPSFQTYMARHLFRNLRAESLDGTGVVTIAGGKDRLGEVELIAKIIKRLVAQNPERDLSLICISMIQPQLYTQLFREVFSRFGIPANITDRYRLDQSTLMSSVMSLLSLPERNYQLDDIMRSLSSPYLRLKSGQSLLDAGNIYAVASLIKASGGRVSWLRRIDERLEMVREKIRLAEDEAEMYSLKRQSDMLDRARNDLEALFSLLQRFGGPMTPGEFKDRLLSMMEELHVVESLLADESGDLQRLEVDTRAHQKFVTFIDSLLEILAIEGKRNERQPLSFYTERLREAISLERFNIRQKYGYGVTVTSFDETRGLKFDVMFLAGLVDGEFPPVYRPELFLSSSRRERREQYYLREHRYLFYQALSNFTEHLYLTYPRFEQEKELVPSSFLDALRDVVRIDEPEESIAGVIANGIYSHDELLEHVGRRLGSEREGSGLPAEEISFFSELHGEYDHMRLAMSVERSRVNNSSFPEFNGIIGSHLNSEALEALTKFRTRVYSVTQLESYGRCPFQFFADKILRLSVIDEIDEELTPLERGDLLHEILFEFYTARRGRSLPPLSGATDDEFMRANEELLAIAGRKLAELHISDKFWEIDKEALLGSPGRAGVLGEFLTNERERKTETLPVYFEAAFGSSVDSSKRTDPTLRHPAAVRAGNVQLRGKIDRIEVGKDFFSIIDYKTGKPSNYKEIGLGVSLQLPLYLYAVERILAEQGGSPMYPAAGSYYALKSPVKESLGVGNVEYNGKAFVKARKSAPLLPDDAALRKVIDQAVAFVNEYVDNIALGNFPVLPKLPETTCLHCEFRTTCRIQLQRPIDGKESDRANEDS